MTALKRLFGDGFRVFFLCAGLFAILSMLVWDLFLSAATMGIDLSLPAAPLPQEWHAHEMIFGYGSAALGGFFLTAVPNWTGAKSARHLFIAGLAGLWLAGRIALWFSGSLPPVWVAVADLGFLPVLALKILIQLLHRPKPQQMIFLVLLTLFWTANLRVHLDWLGVTASGLWEGLQAGLLTLAAMIMVLGGRVTPGFTRNAMVQSGRETSLPRNPKALAIAAIAPAMLLPLASLIGAPDLLIALLGLAAGAAGLARVALWQGAWTKDKPILWSLHLSYAANAAGIAALGLAQLGLGSELAALHLIGIGGVGGMTLAVMSRATLGHTGRALIAPVPVALAYGLLPLAALARLAAVSLPGLAEPALLLSGGLWVLAFSLFLLALWPAFWGPRLDRRASEAPKP